MPRTRDNAPLADIREIDIDTDRSDKPLNFEGIPHSDPHLHLNPEHSPDHGSSTYPDNAFMSGSPAERRYKPLDVNLYQTKKTVAQGMMDIALLTANANQLRYVLEVRKYVGEIAYYHLNLVLISLSLTIQVVIGVMLILMGRYNVIHDHYARKADVLNNWVVLFVFFLTIINIFISAFGIEPAYGINNNILQPREFSADTTTASVINAFPEN